MVGKLLDEGWYKKAVELLDDNKETYRMVVSQLPSKAIHQVVSKMRQHGYTLDPESFKKCLYVVPEDELIECYKQMVAECSTAPDEEVCQIVMEAMAREKMFQEACELVKYMVARGFKPGSMSTLFHGLVQAGMYDDAYIVLETVDDERAHNYLIRALGCDNLDKIGELVKRMLARGYTPYVRSFLDGRALFKLERYEDAHQLVTDTIGRHPEHIGKCFNMLVHGLFQCCSYMNRKRMLKEALECDITPDTNLCIEMKMLVEAYGLMDTAIITSGITPDTESCIAIASALAIAGRRKEASYIFKFAKQLEGSSAEYWILKEHLE